MKQILKRSQSKGYNITYVLTAATGYMSSVVLCMISTLCLVRTEGQRPKHTKEESACRPSGVTVVEENWKLLKRIVTDSVFSRKKNQS